MVLREMKGGSFFSPLREVGMIDEAPCEGAPEDLLLLFSPAQPEKWG